MSGLNFDITADNRTFMNSLHQITAGVRDATRQIEANGNDIDRVISLIKNGVATIGIATGFKELSSQVANIRGEFQKLEVAFETMLGSKEKSDALMAQMIHTAAITPFGMTDVANGAKQLLAYNTAAEDVNDTLIRLGDIAAGLSLPLNDLVYLYGTTMVQGRMFTQDLRQFQGRGIPIADELAKQFGVAKDKVGELVTAGKVGAKEFQAAIISMSSEGGKFAGLMEKQSKTITGQISNIEDAVEQMFNEIGKQTEGIINVTLSATSTIVENWQTVAGIIGTIAAAYGAQKAALALDAGFTKAATNYGYDAEISQLQALLPLKEAEKKTALEQAVASGNLSEAKATQVAALRAEAEAYLQTLAIKQKEAQQAEITAQANLTTALQEKDIADEFVASAQEKWQAAYDSADAIAEEAAAQELQTAKTIQSEAADAVATATKDAKAASSAHVTTQQNLENASTKVNTAQTVGNSAATGILTIAKEKLAVAIAKVNAAMKANQFAIITGAVIALGYAVYKLITYQNDYQKSLSRLEDSEKEYNKSIIQEQHQIDVLFGKLKNAKKGTQEYNDAKDAIMKNYGSYLSKLGDEKNALNDIAKAYKLVQDSAIQAAKARALNSYLEKEDSQYIEDQADNYEKIRQIVIDTKGETFADIHEQNLRDIVEGRKKVNQEFIKQFDNYVTANGITYNANRLAAAIGVSDKRRENYNNAVKEGETRYGIKRGDIANPEVQKETDKNLQQAYDKAKKDYDNAKAKVAEMNANRKAFTEKEYEEATTNLKAYKEAFEKLGGVTEQKGQTASQLASKTAAEEQQVTDLLKKQAEERLRQQKAYEYELWQNRIDLMDEGEAKVIAQMRLDNEKELTALKEHQQQEIQAEIANQKALFDAREDVNASKDKKYAKKVFNPEKDVDTSSIDAINERYTQLYADLEAKQAKSEQDRLDAAKESMNAYLQEFGSYQQKRLALQEEYETKIAEAHEGQRMMLFAQRDKALADLDYSEWIDSGDIAFAFGDISKLSDSTIASLISDMERYREKVVATFDPDKIREYEEALKGLRDAQSEISFGAFADVIPDYFKQRKSVADSRMSAGANLNALRSQRESLLVRKSGLEGAKALGGNVDKELSEVNAQLNDNENATKKAQNAFKQLQEQWDNMNSPEDKFYGICAAVNQAADLVGGLANQAAAMADALGAEGLGEAMDYLGDAMNSVSNIASGFANGGIIGGIAAVAGEAMNWVGKIFSAGDNKKQKNIERLQEQIDELNKSYEKLNSKIDEAFSTDASDLIDQQNTLLQQQKVLIEQQMAEEEAKKKTDDDKIKEYKERIEEIDETIADNKKKAKEAIIGEDIKSAISEFADAYSSAWDDGSDAASKSMSAVKNIITSALNELLNKRLQPTVQKFYDKLADYMGDGILTDYELEQLDLLKAEMDAIAAKEEEQYKKIQDRYKDLDELKEELTDISFDSVRDDFKSQLLDMEADATDFTNSFTDMLRSALVEGLMNNKYDAMLKEWYDEFAEAMEDQTLSDEERDSLRQQYQAIVDQGIADRNAINELVGGGAYSQEASTGGWEAMGQDQADELNGRFTALTELQVISNDLQQTQNVLASQILATLQSLTFISGTGASADPTLIAIKDMMFLSTGYLEDIAKYTKILNTVDERLATLNSTIDRKL